LLKVTV